MRDEENVYLERLGADYTGSLMEDGILFSDLKKAFLNSNINMEMDKPNVTWIMSESLLGDIEKAMSDLLMIAEKPRSFIETHDEKVLVESASHIGHKAIAQLSRDSKDWYARTFVSVKPKNITAEVSEETFNIYENRVFVSLIRRIEKDIYVKKRDAEDRLRKQEEALSSKDIDDYLGLNSGDYSAWSFGLYKRAVWEKGDCEDDAELNELEELLARIDKIGRQITRIKTSPVYKALGRIKNEHSPILHTNIFLYDRRYKKALELWRAMDKEKFQIDEEISEHKIDEEQAKINYGLYVLLTFAYAFADLGYEATPTSGKLFYDYSEAYIDGTLSLQKGDHEFKLSGHTSENLLKISYENSALKVKKSFSIHLDYQNFEELETTSEFDKKTKAILDSHVHEKPDRFAKPVRHITCVSFDGASKLGGLLDEKLARRILSFGDSYSKEENPEDLAAWGNYQTGFLDIVPQKNFRNNLLKVERFLIHITVESLDKTNLTKANGVCPICGSKSLRQMGAQDTDYSCYHCRHFISFTPHKKCHVDKQGRLFLWIKPDDTKFLQKQKERFHFGQNKFLLYQFTQFIFGKYATTGFSVSLDSSGKVVYNTICPKCGDILD